MKEDFLKLQIKIEQDIHPEVYNHLSMIRKTGRCEAARMLMQKALHDKALVHKILKAIPSNNLIISHHPVDQAKNQDNQKDFDKEDLSFLDDITFGNPEDFENN